MILKKILVYIGILFFTVQFSHSQNKAIKIKLSYSINDSINFSNDLIDFRLYPLDEFPLYVKNIMITYNGIPDNDSISLFSNSKRSTQFYYNLFKKGFYSQDDFYQLISEKKLDTLNQSKIKFPESLVVLVGFKKDKEFLIADVNRNQDFSDDIKYEYDIDFRNHSTGSLEILNKQPMSTFLYETLNNGKILIHSRKFILYPDRYGLYALDGTSKDQEYYSSIRFKDFWKGQTIINNQSIEFYYLPTFGNYNGIVYAKPQKDKFSKSDYNYNNQYLHRLNEEIYIAGEKVKIDSVSNNFSELYLKRIEGYKDNYGNIVGTYLKEVEFYDLDNKLFSTNDIVGKKNYTLIDFWGTWCGPCVVLTPKLKKMQQEYDSKLNILSIAVDENIGLVKKYIFKNSINWINAFLPKNEIWNNPIIKQMNIEYYPSFILLDVNGKIISRGGAQTLEEMEKLIKSQ